MKVIKFFSSMLTVFLFCCTAVANPTYRFECPASEFTLRSDRSSDAITFPYSKLSYAIGCPSIPIRSVRLIIPNDFIPSKVKVVSKTCTALDTVLRIEPGLGNGLVTESGYKSIDKDISVYSTDAFYPGKLVELSNVGWLFGAHVAELLIYPVQYNPVTGETNLYTSLDLQLIGDNTALNRPTMHSSKYVRYLDRTCINNKVDNPENVDMYYQSPVEISTYRELGKLEYPSRDREIDAEDGAYVSIDYMIITKSEFVNAFTEFRDNKRSRGLTCEIVSIEDITANAVAGAVPSVDGVDRIRTFLRFAYQHYGTRWVLLGGDVDVVPTQHIFSEFASRSVPTDQYYSCLEDEYWNTNKNEIIGDIDGYWDNDNEEYVYLSDQMDLHPSVYVGRVPARTVTEVADFVQKMSSYNSNFTEEFRNRALITTSDIIFSSDSKVYDLMLSLSMPNTVDITHLYHHDGLSFTSFQSALNYGYSLIFSVSHGNEYLLTCGDDVIQRDDLIELENENKCGLWISVACEPGMYDSDCFGESWIRSTTGGGVGFIGCSTFDCPEISVREFLVPFQLMLSNRQYYRMGEVLAMSKLDNLAAACTYGVYRSIYMGYNLLGDPEAYIWTDEPHEFDPDIPMQYYAGEENDDDLNIVDLTSQTVVPHVALGLSLEGDFSYSSFSDAEGVLESGTLFPDSIASATLTITAPNYLPYTTTIPIVSGSNPPTITNYKLNDITGNIANDLIDAGETFDLDTYLYNSKTSAYSGVNCTITSASSFLSIATASSSFPTLASQLTVKNSTQFRFTVDKAAPDSTVIPLTFSFSYQSETWDETIDFLVHSPIIDLQNVWYDDDAGSNYNYKYDPAETFYLDLTLANTGSGAIKGLTTGTLTTSDTRVDQITGSYSFEDMAGSSDGECINRCQITLNSSGIAGNPPIHFTLAINDQYNRAINEGIDIPIEIDDPLHENWFTQFDSKSVEVMWEPYDVGEFQGYEVFRKVHDAPSNTFVKLHRGIITGGSRFVDSDPALDVDETYDYQVRVVINSDEPSIIFANGNCYWLSYSAKSGFPYSMGFEQPVGGIGISDFNQNDVFELWSGNSSGTVNRVRAIEGAPTITNNGFTAPPQGAITWISDPVIGNIDGDPRPEMVFNVRSEDGEDKYGYVYIYEVVDDVMRANPEHILYMEPLTVENMFPNPIYFVPYNNPSMMDIDSDGKPEIVSIGHSGSSNMVFTFNYISNEGHWEWQSRNVDIRGNSIFGCFRYVYGGSFNTANIAIGEPDGNDTWLFFGTGQNKYEFGDGKKIIGQQYVGYDGTDDHTWMYPGTGATETLSEGVAQIVIGEIDGAGTDELVFITRDHVVHVLDSETGDPVDWWLGDPDQGLKLYSSLEPYGTPGICLADMFDTGELQMIFASIDTVYIFGPDGDDSLLYAKWPRNNHILENFGGTPLVADLDNDSEMDVLLPNGHHQIEAWNNQGEMLEHWPIIVGDRITDYKLKDVDNDSELELVVVTQGGLVSVFDIGATGAVEWGQAQHDDWHTNRYGFTPPAFPDLASDFHAYGCWSDVDNVYDIGGDLIIDAGQVLHLEPGIELQFASVQELKVSPNATLIAEGTSENHITFTKSGSSYWHGFYFPSSSYANNSSLKYCDISYVSWDGMYISYQSNSTDYLNIENCLIEYCSPGISIPSSYVTIKNTEVRNCGSKGLNISSCGAGKVKIEDCSIHDNGGTQSSYSYTGIYVGSSSAPEIVGCDVFDNSGSGINVSSSAPDLNTNGTGGSHANTITSNGTGTQSGSSGCEIYLSQSSYPDIYYNNIHDVVSNDNTGSLIYKYTSTSDPGIVDAQYNYWGEDASVDEYDFGWTYTSPPKSFSQVFNIANSSSSEVSDLSNWEQGMVHWEAGEFEEAMDKFVLAVHDSEAESINSIHYLSGCYSKLGRDFSDLRQWLSNVADTTEIPMVKKTAIRFATNCLTEQGDFEGAAAEYDNIRRNSESLSDSIEAVIDYVLVCEQGGLEINAANGERVTQIIDKLQALLDSRTGEKKSGFPTTYRLYEVFPNPFNGLANIRYDLPEPTEIKLSVYDLSGREVITLVSGRQQAGYHKVDWQGVNQNGIPISSGMYFIKMEAGQFLKTQKVTLVK